MHDLTSEFAVHATNGYLGDPAGASAYAYLRASSERQVEEGSSFSRQIESIHKAASRDELRVPLEFIYFDDGYTGYEFEHRPALLELLYEIRSHPRASHLVLEDIDRLSRNADWQQGYLLEEFFRNDVKVHFFSDPGSALERYIRGYMAQEEMRKAKERMRMGNVYKAMSGKVTAKRPRYGYTLTDESQYALHPEESKVMRWVYDQIIYHAATLHQIAQEMNERNVPTRFKTGFWTPGTLYQLVKSEVYKGEFYANRYRQVGTGEYNGSGRAKRKTKQRPKEEWIPVEVPAIVTPEEWGLAQESMSRNAKRSLRNSKKREWLLSGCLMKCALCKDYCLVAIVGGSKNKPIRYYGCNSRDSEKARGLGTACFSPYVKADEIERRVWEEIEAVIYDPSIIIGRLKEKLREEQAMVYEEQLAFIDQQVDKLTKERKKFEAAYFRDIYTLDEFEEKMKDLAVQRNSLEVSRARIEAKLSETHSIDEQKRVVLAALAKVRETVERARKEGRQPNEIPFKLKRKILSLLVEVIWVNSPESTFVIEGEIHGTFALGEDSTIPDSNSGENFGLTSSRKWQ